MDFTVNSRIITDIFNDEKSFEEIIGFLNEIIDAELEKENPDCDLIDDCINAVDEIQNEMNIYPALKLVASKKRVMAYCRNKSKISPALKAVIAACLVMIMSGAVAMNVSPAFAEGVKEFFETIVSTVFDSSNDTENDTNISSIYASYGGNVNNIKSENDIDENKFEITAVHADGSEEKVSIKSCKVDKSLEHTENGECVFVSISYKGSACTMAFEIKR